MTCKRLLRALALPLLIASAAAGCWDARDINDRNIVTAVIVDKTDYGFRFTAEVPIIAGGTKEGGESSPQQKTSIIHSEGRTYAEARENLDRRMDKPIFLGAVQTVILTEKLAEYDIEEYLIRLRQLSEYRKTVHVVVTQTDPSELLAGRPENAQSVGFSIDSTLMNLVSTGQMQDVSLMDVLEKLASPYPRYILPTIALLDGDPTYTGYTVFSGGMKTGFIPAAECNAIVYIRSIKPRLEYVVPYGDTYATTQVLITGKKITPEYADGKVSFQMDLRFKAILLYPEKDEPVPEEDMESIRGALTATLEKEFTDMFRKSAETYDYDCFNLYQHFRIAYPEEYKRMNWADEYRKATLHLSVGVDLCQSLLIDYHN